LCLKGYRGFESLSLRHSWFTFPKTTNEGLRAHASD
jgi:hypothetical protein